MKHGGREDRRHEVPVYQNYVRLRELEERKSPAWRMDAVRRPQ
jgi:hypothetical protein